MKSKGGRLLRTLKKFSNPNFWLKKEFIIGSVSFTIGALKKKDKKERICDRFLKVFPFWDTLILENKSENKIKSNIREDASKLSSHVLIIDKVCLPSKKIFE